ncbi:MAG TPA: DUF1385 domain-containing protein [Gaiellales bacterium]|jgi:uncharacterized protein YqhQ
MALRNGLLVHGPTSWAAAVRTSDGTVRSASGRKPELPAALLRLPLVRGIARMGEVMALLPIVRKGLPEARLPFEDPRVGAAILATSLATGGLRKSRLSAGRAEAISSVVGLVPPLIALRSSHELAGYHGAEHKAIGAYEHGGEAFDAAKEHERCGTHLVGPMIISTALANLVAAQLPERARKIGRVGGSLVAMGVAVEVFTWVDRHRGSRVATAMARPGFAFQRAVATEEPSAEQLEVAERALSALLEAEAVAAA